MFVQNFLPTVISCQVTKFLIVSFVHSQPESFLSLCHFHALKEGKVVINQKETARWS